MVSDATILAMEPFVRGIAGKFSRRSGLTRDELISAGWLGVMQAAHSFKLGSASFKTHAMKRLRGAMQDEVRKFMHAQGFSRTPTAPTKHTQRIAFCGLDVEDPIIPPFDVRVFVLDPTLLTRRQRQVLALVRKGYVRDEIATILHVSASCVSMHMAGLTQRLAARVAA